VTGEANANRKAHRLTTCATGDSEGLTVPREPAQETKRSPGGRSAVSSEQVKGRMPAASVRRRGTGSLEPDAPQEGTQVDNLCYVRKAHRLTTCATGDSEGLPVLREPA